MKTPQKIAVWAFINEKENPRIKKGCENILKKFAELGAESRLTVSNISGGHFAWSWAYAEPDLIPWLFSHKRDKNAEIYRK